MSQSCLSQGSKRRFVKICIQKAVTVPCVLEGIDSTPTILVSNESLGQADLKDILAYLNFFPQGPSRKGCQGRDFFGLKWFLLTSGLTPDGP